MCTTKKNLKPRPFVHQDNATVKTKDNQLSAIGLLLLLSFLMALVVSAPTSAQEDLEQNTDLTSMSIEDLMNIEIYSTATLTKTSPRLVPAAVTTITAEQIQASGARSLDELLDIYVPNLQLIRHHWESDHLGLRGILNENKYLLLVNGRVINERTHIGAVTERDLVLLRDIHHIDVVRGSGSALYGPGAVSMVINIITYTANTFQGTEVTGRLGAIEEFYTGEVKHGQKFDDNDGGVFLYTGVGKYVGASKFDAPQIFPFTFPSSSYDTRAGEPFTNAPINRDGAESKDNPPLKIHAQLTRDNWDIWGRYSRGGKQFLWAPGLWAPNPWGYAESQSRVTNNFYGYQQMTGYVGHKQELTKDIDIDYAFSYDTTEFTEFRQNAIDDAYREDEYYGKAMLQWQPNDRHKVAFGSEVFHRELGIKKPGWPDERPISQAFKNNGLTMPRWSTNMYSLLGEWQWNISEQWTTFLGGRVDDHTYTERMISPRAAIVWTPNEKDTLKAMWSRSVRANMEEEMKVQALNGGGDSKPEKLDSVELRYERQQSKNLDLAASVFVHYNLQLVDWSQSANATTTVGTQREYGLEFEAAYHTEKTRLAISHSYTKLYSFSLSDPCTITFVTARPYGFGNDLAYWSNHLTKVTAQHKLNDKWTLDASMRIYWGFPGMEDYGEYDPYTYPGARPNNPFIEEGWKKAYRSNYYLNLGLQYQPNKDLTIGIVGYYLLGIFDKDLNKRNYFASSGDYRSYAPAVAVSVAYKF